MKHMVQLSDLLSQLSLDVPEQAEPMLRHLDWVIEANKTLNLTRISDEAEALRLHLVDSLTVLPELESCPPGPLLDLGTGAGFPGVPLGFATGRDTLLVDSVAKKVRAIDEFLRAEKVENIRTSSDRAEDLASAAPGTWAVVTARAVTALPSLVELAAPLLGRGGRLIAMKGPIEADELDRGERVAEMVGLKLTSQRFLSLPGGGEARTILVFERTGDSEVPLPRRNGMAQKRPLA